MTDWNEWLTRWTDAGLIDAAVAARIRDYETERAGSGKLRWPAMVAIGFGALMLGGGVLLFVAAHWDALSPGARFAIVLAMVGGFHILGAVVGESVPGLSAALHGVGTVALGAGISLAGQIFNLDEHWPSGVLAWAVGAAAAWAVLRQTPQAALLASLVPAWLLGEWSVAVRYRFDWMTTGVAAAGAFMTALTYFTLAGSSRRSGWERALLWVGGVALPLTALLLALSSARNWVTRDMLESMPLTTRTVGWVVAIGLPLALALIVRRARAWPFAVAAVWTVVLLFIERAVDTVALYPWWVLGAGGLVAWGIDEGRSERVNMGAAIFAATVVAFYFSEVMDKLGRSASLIGLGLLFLAGGWALERLRRRLVQQARGIA
jgi:uncharacterized membrane protein